jgi:PAN domain
LYFFFLCRNVRDWDYYGTPYTLLSAIATGGTNLVVNGLPARDEGEFTAFPLSVDDPRAASIDFYRTWFAFAANNFATLLKTKFFPVPPAIGVIDGTYAMWPNGTGFIFLFNPNGLAATTPNGLLVMDQTHLGVTCNTGDTFSISELFPLNAPLTTVTCGSNFSVTVEGRNTLILSVLPVSSLDNKKIHLFGRGVRAYSTAILSNDRTQLLVDGLEDIINPTLVSCRNDFFDQAVAFALIPTSLTEEIKSVQTPKGTNFLYTWYNKIEDSNIFATSMQEPCLPRARSFAPLPVAPADYQILVIHIQTLRTDAAAAASFLHKAPVTGLVPTPGFAGGLLSGTVHVPSSVFSQLSSRNASYPVPWDANDVPIAWLLPGRILLYIDAIRGTLPSTSVINATLGGVPLPVQPVWSCRTTREEKCFQGFFMDLSTAGIIPDTDIPITVTIPSVSPGGIGPFVGIDMRDGDLPGMPLTLNASDYNLCAAICNQTSNCVGWAYGDYSAGCEPAPHCWLKEELGPTDVDACRVIGYKVAPPSGFVGVFYDNIDTIYDSFI